MSALKAIHVGRKALGLDDDDYRATLERITGKRSAAQLTEAQRRNVIREFRRLGMGASPNATAVTGPFASKLKALWLSAYNLGVAADRRDSAMVAFVERQTGIARVQWLREPRDARRAIEGLKAWIAREAGVDWPSEDDGRSAKLSVIHAQRRILGDMGAIEIDPFDLDGTIARLGVQVRALG
ncbi:MAG: regulatory protein GemA [Sphingomonadales bacterium]|nr:regulatory protein GemA [Sphingomonadales bacterium]